MKDAQRLNRKKKTPAHASCRKMLTGVNDKTGDVGQGQGQEAVPSTGKENHHPKVTSPALCPSQDHTG